MLCSMILVVCQDGEDRNRVKILIGLFCSKEKKKLSELKSPFQCSNENIKILHLDSKGEVG